MAKVANKHFWRILAEQAGLYLPTAKAIKEELGISITRGAVYKRAQRDKDRLNAILEGVKDKVEKSLLDLIENGSPAVKLKAIELFTKKMPERGYGDVASSNVINLNQITFNLKEGRSQLLTEEDKKRLQTLKLPTDEENKA